MTRTLVVVSILLGLTGSAAAQDYDLGGARKPAPDMSLKRDWQYKRVHQVALRYLLLGRDADAESFLNDYQAKNPDDAETSFLLGLLKIRAGKHAEAATEFKAALEKGLPPQRLIVGPRELLEPVKDAPPLKDAFAAHRNKPVQGPLVGHTTGTTASFWIRTAEASDVRVSVSSADDRATTVASGSGKSSAETDYTTVVTVAGLQPATEYEYSVAVDDGAPVRSEHQRFQTFPSHGESAQFSIAFGGGAGFVPPHERMWDTIRAEDPLALLLLGDNVYIDDPESPEMQRYTYYRRQSRPEWRELTAQTAVYTIWDDHDFSTNDSWGGPLIDKPFWKRDYSWTIYKQNWANPGYGGGVEQPGCWYTFSIGDVDFIMLDCRYYRTDPKSDTLSMLGPVQLEWLKQQLAASPGTFKVLCSSVPWDFRTKGGSKDTWNGYRDEREAIFGFIEQNEIEGVVLMSADRHRSDAWQIERPDGYDFYEFNSSRLTNQHVHQTMVKQGALFSYNKKQSFGLVSFDTSTNDPQVTYEVISIDGERIDSLTVRRSQLKFD